MKTLNQVLSVTLSLAIATTAAPWQVYAAAPTGIAAFAQPLVPPTRLGYLVDSFQGTSTNKPIVLIQDLHANYGVQKKIAALLSFLQPKIAAPGQALVIGREGESQEVQLGNLLKKSPEYRKVAADILTKHAAIAGTEYYALTAKEGARIVGVEDKADYDLATSLIRASFSARLALASKAEKLRTAINDARVYAPSELQRVWKAEDSYLSGEIDVDELARKLHLPSLDYNGVEQALLDRKTELAEKTNSEHKEIVKSAVLADHYLSLLGRMFRQQMTLEEVRYTVQNTDTILALVQHFLPEENMDDWKEAIRASADFYTIALMRNKPLTNNAVRLATENPTESVVLVTGGFHTDGITRMLREQNMSYAVIAPVVESHTLKDEMLYVSRLMGLPIDLPELQAEIKASKIQAMHQTSVDHDAVDAATDPNKATGEERKDLMVADKDSTRYVPSFDKALPSIQSEYAKDLAEIQGMAEGLGLDLKGIEWVINPSDVAEETFSKDGRFIGVIHEKLFKNYQAAKASGDQQKITDTHNALVIAIAKVGVNVREEKAGNLGEKRTTTELLLALLGGKDGLQMDINAISAAIKSMDMGTGPFIAMLENIAGKNIGADAQREWIIQNRGKVEAIVLATVGKFAKKYGVSFIYVNGDAAHTILQQLQDAGQALRTVKAGALGLGKRVLDKTSHFLPAGTSEDKINEMIKERHDALFGDQA